MSPRNSLASAAACGVLVATALVSGANSPLLTIPSWTAESDQLFANFGWAVAGAGDVNNDGYDDVIVGAVFLDNPEQDEGQTRVYLGGPSGLSATPAWVVDGNNVSANFGHAVSGAGDVNNDGYDDVIVGAPHYFNPEVREGRAFVYHGRIGGPSTLAAWTGESNQDEANFGWSVAGAGDVNNDGYDDIVVGAPFYDSGEIGEGRAYVYHGGGSGISLTAAWMTESNQASANFGWSVAGAGDVNGDGYADVIVGAPLYSNGETEEGRVYLYLGGSSGLAPAPAWVVEGNQAFANFGWAVSGAGDVNGDGYADVIVGANRYTNGEAGEGRAYVYLGGSGGLAATPVWMGESNQDFAGFGWSVAGAGDVNRDGYADVIVGAYQYDGGQPDEGRAYLYLGGSGGLDTAAVWTGESDQNLAWFGYSVGGAGDVDGNGYSDVIVGLPHGNNPESNEGRAFVYHGLDVVPVSLQSFESHWDGASVVVTWTLLEVTDGVTFEVIRSDTPGGRPRQIENPQIRALEGRFVFRDRTAAPGTTYTYGISIIEDGIAVTFFETTVAVPARGLTLDQNYPNPFNPQTKIRFTLDRAGPVTLRVYDVSGALVRTLIDRFMTAGDHAEVWNGLNDAGRRVGSGTYFVHLTAAKRSLVKKAVLMK